MLPSILRASAFLAGGLAAAALGAAPADLAAVRAWREAHAHEVLAEFAEWLAIPNVAADRENIEWRLYARSAGDDKAPVAALLAALDALAAAGTAPSSNLVLLFEGEEEAGSPHLPRYLAEHRDRLRVDGWLFCDGPIHQSRRPQLVFGVRGVTGLEITVYGATRALHSGHYGNWAPNPAQRLADLLASMKDEADRVRVEGFYEGIVPIGSAERAAMAELPRTAQVIAAARRAAGEDLLLVPGLGGSLPLCLFTDVLAAPAIIAPIANHDDNQHAADENLRLANLWYGVDLMASLLTME